MPVLRNAKYEAFAQAVAKGKSATEAYEEAGFKPHRQNAARLMTNDDVRKRVEEIQARVAEKAEWRSADRLRMLAIIAKGNLRKDPRSSIAAIAEANKMQGSHAVVRHQIGGITDNPIEVVHTIERRIVRPTDTNG
jgi:phage terminase small subunit